jgi:hypothetical protein
MPKDRIDALTEAADAEFMYQYEAIAAPPTKTALGIATTRIGGGVALSMRNDVTEYWSKALGSASLSSSPQSSSAKWWSSTAAKTFTSVRRMGRRRDHRNRELVHPWRSQR